MTFGTIFRAILFLHIPYLILFYHLMLEKKELTIKEVLFPWPKNRLMQFAGVFFFALTFLFLFRVDEGAYSSPKDHLAVLIVLPMIFITPILVRFRFIKRDNQWIFITPDPISPPKYLVVYIVITAVVIKTFFK